MTNLDLAKLFRAVAAALSLEKGDNRFRIIAYERAADAIEHSSSEVKDLWDNNELDTLPGIGTNIASHLDELFKTGKVRHFSQILKSYPEALFELLEVPGIGPKSAYKLCKALGISSAHSALSRLEKAAKDGHISRIEGFGKDSESEILRSLTEFRHRDQRLLLPVASSIADEIILWMKKIPQVKQIYPLGSLRRQASTIGDVDIAVAATDAKIVILHFIAFPKKSRVLESGVHTASLVLPNGCQIDLMVQPPASFGSLLQHFTGSKHHNILLREYALKKGLSLSEYGIKTKNSLKTFSTEEKFYGFLGLDWIPPELREGKNEIELARVHQLPDLVKLENIKGDLQIHSNLDVESSHDLGESTISQLATSARALGYEYIGLTEHNPGRSNHTDTQIIELIKRKSHEISNFNRENRSLYVFNGLEIDIQPDGRLSVPESCLDLLDYACVSLHSSFRLPRKSMTDRVLSALNHPKVRFLAHPTARLLEEREGVELDWETIFAFCRTHAKWLEIDAWPNRLDLPDVLVKEALSAGVKLVIDTDSHSADHLSYMRYGISVARRGWAKPNDIINTQSLSQITGTMKGGDY